MEKSYRRCVVAVLVNAEQMVLVGERADAAGSWQFPQGGVDAGESDEQAIRREVREEIGLADFEILVHSLDLIRYDFPADLAEGIGKKFRGQEQRWFLIRSKHGAIPSLELATDKEFQRLAWVKAESVTAGVISWKQQAYRDGLRSLGLGAKI